MHLAILKFFFQSKMCNNESESEFAEASFRTSAAVSVAIKEDISLSDSDLEGGSG